MPTFDITCTSCQFAATASPDDEDNPSTIIRRHGLETGHMLTFSRDERGARQAAD